MATVEVVSFCLFFCCKQKTAYEMRISDWSSDVCSSDLIEGCAEPTPDRPRTWINDRIITLYTSLFHMGRAHSIECRNEGELIGGLYGVALGGVFFGAIGRASCRASVCQYVYISVVAV